MSPDVGLSRRNVLISLGVTSGLTVLHLDGEAAAETPPGTQATARNGPRSQNGWPVNVQPQEFTIEGSTASVSLASGYPAMVLLHAARRINYEVLTLEKGDVQGREKHNARTAADYESNYLSGTAFAIRPDLFPTGSKGNLYPWQIALIRDILLDCDGAVWWGGDDKNTPKEGHFQLDVTPQDARLRTVAAKLHSWSEAPNRGPGVPTNPFKKSRRNAALHLARKQHRN